MIDDLIKKIKQDYKLSSFYNNFIAYSSNDYFVGQASLTDQLIVSEKMNVPSANSSFDDKEPEKEKIKLTQTRLE